MTLTGLECLRMMKASTTKCHLDPAVLWREKGLRGKKDSSLRFAPFRMTFLRPLTCPFKLGHHPIFVAMACNLTDLPLAHLHPDCAFPSVQSSNPDNGRSHVEPAVSLETTRVAVHLPCYESS